VPVGGSFAFAALAIRRWIIRQAQATYQLYIPTGVKSGAVIVHRRTGNGTFVIQQQQTKAKAKSIPNGPNCEPSTPILTHVQANGAATFVNSAASTAIVEAVRAYSDGNGPFGDDRPEGVYRVWTECHARA